MDLEADHGSEGCMIDLDPHDPLLHWVDGLNRPGQPFGPVRPRERRETQRSESKPRRARGAKIKDWSPSDREVHPLTERTESIAGTFARIQEDRPEALAKSPSPAPSEHVHVRSYAAPNWYSVAGVLKKRKLIEAKGLPSFRYWRFVTLTINQDLFSDPLEAYLAAKDHMRRFLYSMRLAGLMNDGGKWAWKLEFQENGWPHWHLLHDRITPYTEEQFREIDRLWGLGCTSTEMVREDDFAYSFKYAFKPVQSLTESDDFENSVYCAPDWFLDYYERGVDGKKPKSFSRVRFWQTSKGFYTGPAAPASDKSDPVSQTVPVPARQAAERAEKSVQVVARERSGKYAASIVIALTCYTGTLWTRAAWDTLHGHAVGMAINSFVIPTQTIKSNTLTKWRLDPILKQNHLTLKRAVRLHSQGQTFKTC